MLSPLASQSPPSTPHRATSHPSASRPTALANHPFTPPHPPSPTPLPPHQLRSLIPSLPPTRRPLLPLPLPLLHPLPLPLPIRRRPARPRRHPQPLHAHLLAAHHDGAVAQPEQPRLVAVAVVVEAALSSRVSICRQRGGTGGRRTLRVTRAVTCAANTFDTLGAKCCIIRLPREGSRRRSVMRSSRASQRVEQRLGGGVSEVEVRRERGGTWFGGRSSLCRGRSWWMGGVVVCVRLWWSWMY